MTSCGELTVKDIQRIVLHCALDYGRAIIISHIYSHVVVNVIGEGQFVVYVRELTESNDARPEHVPKANNWSIFVQQTCTIAKENFHTATSPMIRSRNDVNTTKKRNQWTTNE